MNFVWLEAAENLVEIIQYNKAKNSESAVKISRLRAPWRQSFPLSKILGRLFPDGSEWTYFILFFISHLVFQESIVESKYGLLSAALHFPIAREYIHPNFMLKILIPQTVPGASSLLLNPHVVLTTWKLQPLHQVGFWGHFLPWHRLDGGHCADH